MIATYEVCTPIAKSSSTMFISKKVSDLFKKVEFFCSQGGSLIFISGEDKCGKTSFSKYLVENLNIQEYESILLSIFNEQYNSGWLLSKIYQRLGIDYRDKRLDITQSISKEIDQLFEEHKNLTVVIDGIDLLMNEKAISDISFLMNIQGVSGSKINFVLLGKKVFLEKIKSTNILDQLSYFCEFPCLDKDDIYDYFVFKAQNLGIKSCSLSKEGIDYIYGITDGKIYDISLILDNCLIDAEIKQLKSIEKINIEEIINKHILSLKGSSNINTNTDYGKDDIEGNDSNVDVDINNNSSSNNLNVDSSTVENKESIGLKLDNKNTEDNLKIDENIFSNISFSNEEHKSEEVSNEVNTEPVVLKDTVEVSANVSEDKKEEKEEKASKKIEIKNFLDDIFKNNDDKKENESFMDLIKKS